MQGDVVIRIGTFAERLAEVELPAPERLREPLVDLLRSEAERVGQLFRYHKHRELAHAVGVEEHERLRLDAIRTRLTWAETRMRVDDSCWQLVLAVGIFLLLCAASCIASELVISRAVIPWLLSVPVRSWFGTALSVAPAVAPIVLDRVIGALFDVDDAWAGLTSAATSRFGRLGRRVIRVAFFVAVGAVTLSSVWLLTDARAIASLLKATRATTMTVAQRELIDAALRMLAIALMVNGALFYLYGLHELKRAQSLFSAARDVKRSRHELAQIEASHSRAAAERRSVDLEWKEIDDLERAAVTAHIADGVAQLELVLARPRARRPIRDIVADRLHAVADRERPDRAA